MSCDAKNAMSCDAKNAMPLSGISDNGYEYRAFYTYDPEGMVTIRGPPTPHLYKFNQMLSAIAAAIGPFCDTWNDGIKLNQKEGPEEVSFTFKPNKRLQYAADVIEKMASAAFNAYIRRLAAEANCISTSGKYKGYTNVKAAAVLERMWVAPLSASDHEDLCAIADREEKASAEKAAIEKAVAEKAAAEKAAAEKAAAEKAAAEKAAAEKAVAEKAAAEKDAAEKVAAEKAAAEKAALAKPTEETDLLSWLETINLGHYHKVLEGLGATCPQDLIDLDEDDIVDLEFKTLEKRRFTTAMSNLYDKLGIERSA